MIGIAIGTVSAIGMIIIPFSAAGSSLFHFFLKAVPCAIFVCHILLTRATIRRTGAAVEAASEGVVTMIEGGTETTTVLVVSPC